MKAEKCQENLVKRFFTAWTQCASDTLSLMKTAVEKRNDTFF